MKFLNNYKLNQNRTVLKIEKKLFINKVMNLAIVLMIGFFFANSAVFAQNNYGTTFVQLSGGSISSKSNGSNLPQGFIGSDIKDKDGNVWVRVGAPVILNSEIKRARGMGKPGRINIQCVSTMDVNGKPVALTGSISLEGQKKLGKALGLGLGLGLTVLCPWGLFFFCIKGEDVVAPSIIPNVIAQQ